MVVGSIKTIYRPANIYRFLMHIYVLPPPVESQIIYTRKYYKNDHRIKIHDIIIFSVDQEPCLSKYYFYLSVP